MKTRKNLETGCWAVLICWLQQIVRAAMKPQRAPAVSRRVPAGTAQSTNWTTQEVFHVTANQVTTDRTHKLFERRAGSDTAVVFAPLAFVGTVILAYIVTNASLATPAAIGPITGSMLQAGAFAALLAASRTHATDGANTVFARSLANNFSNPFSRLILPPKN